MAALSEIRLVVEMSAELMVMLDKLLGKVDAMSAEMDALVAQVAETNTVIESAVVLIGGLRQQLLDAGTDPQKLADLAASLDASEQNLANAVATEPPV